MEIISKLRTDNLVAVYNDDKLFEKDFMNFDNIGVRDAVNYVGGDYSLVDLIKEVVTDRPRGCFIILEYNDELVLLCYNKAAYMINAIDIFHLN
ncbi:hypothetical protein ACFFHK_05615 [Gallibacterium trehalosifermentans]|uniref:Uncharacterized protein n=1 Tax=Gallibacterium trehalosifermentans TaxID=516935 RepID=A0ABV6H0M9_9PAST